MCKMISRGFLYAWLLFALQASLGEGAIGNAHLNGLTGITPKKAYDTLRTFRPRSHPQDPKEAEKKDLSGNSVVDLIYDTLAQSSTSNDNWITFGKRVALNLMSDTKGRSQVNSATVDKELSSKVISMVPQLVKDSLKVQKDGSILPTLQEKVAEIAKAYKASKDTNSQMQDRQGTPLDPVVFGVNSLINLMWFGAFSSMMLPNMGLENLMSPDYYYEYEDEESETKEEKKAAKEEEKSPVADDNNGYYNNLPTAGYPQSHPANPASSYSHYNGQVLNTNEIRPSYVYLNAADPPKRR